jgi:hypothetical protein
MDLASFFASNALAFLLTSGAGAGADGLTVADVILDFSRPVCGRENPNDKNNYNNQDSETFDCVHFNFSLLLMPQGAVELSKIQRSGFGFSHLKPQAWQGTFY